MSLVHHRFEFIEQCNQMMSKDVISTYSTVVFLLLSTSKQFTGITAYLHAHQTTNITTLRTQPNKEKSPVSVLYWHKMALNMCFSLMTNLADASGVLAHFPRLFPAIRFPLSVPIGDAHIEFIEGKNVVVHPLYLYCVNNYPNCSSVGSHQLGQLPKTLKHCCCLVFCLHACPK